MFWHCKLKRLAYERVKTYARLIKGHKYCSSPVQRRYILAIHWKFNSVKDEGQMIHRASFQYFSMLYSNSMSSYKKKKDIKQMVWWCVWYISHSFSYFVQCAKTCWSLHHVSIVTCCRSFVALHFLFAMNLWSPLKVCVQCANNVLMLSFV